MPRNNPNSKPLSWTGIYNHTTNDHRVGQLTDTAYRLLICSLQQANQHRTEGPFPDTASTPEAMAWVARPTGDAKGAIQELCDLGLWAHDDDRWVIPDFDQLAYVSRKAEEGRKNSNKRWHRDKHIPEGRPNPDCHYCDAEFGTPEPVEARTVAAEPSEQSGAVHPAAPVNEHHPLVEVIDGFVQDHPNDPFEAYRRAAEDLSRAESIDDLTRGRALIGHAAHFYRDDLDETDVTRLAKAARTLGVDGPLWVVNAAIDKAGVHPQGDVVAYLIATAKGMCREGRQQSA